MVQPHTHISSRELHTGLISPLFRSLLYHFDRLLAVQLVAGHRARLGRGRDLRLQSGRVRHGVPVRCRMGVDKASVVLLLQSIEEMWGAKRGAGLMVQRRGSEGERVEGRELWGTRGTSSIYDPAPWRVPRSRWTLGEDAQYGTGPIVIP